jgi:hypothetical protein
MVRFFCLLALSLGTAAVCAGGDTAERLFREGQHAAKAGDSLHAYILFARAAALEPQNGAYALAKAEIETSSQIVGKRTLGPDPADESLPATLAEQGVVGSEVFDVGPALPPKRLAGSPGTKSFDIKGDARMVFEQVAGAYGLQVVFDSDYQSPPPFLFRVTDLTYEQALHALEDVANSFIVPVNERLALVVRDTVQKRTELAPAMSIAIPIPERMSPQDAQEIVTAVQQTMEIRRISVDPSRRLVLIRDGVSKVTAARRLFENLSQLRAQVEVEVEFLSVEKSSSLAYGLNVPSSFPIVNFGTALHNMPSIPSGLTSFLTFGGGATFLGMGIADAAALATVTRSSSDVILRSQVTTLDGQAASLHIGDRYPVISTGYYGTTTGTGQTYAPPPTVNYEDLGLVLKVTPSVHDQNEVTLDVDAEFKVLGTGGSNGIPVIASRTYQGKVRVGGGEWAVIAGLVTINDSQTYSGIAGLVDLPWIGRWFRQNNHQTGAMEVLLVLKPHLVTLPPSEFAGKAIWVGTEAKPITVF